MDIWNPENWIYVDVCALTMGPWTQERSRKLGGWQCDACIIPRGDLPTVYHPNMEPFGIIHDSHMYWGMPIGTQWYDFTWDLERATEMADYVAENAQILHHYYVGPPTEDQLLSSLRRLMKIGIFCRQFKVWNMQCIWCDSEVEETSLNRKDYPIPVRAYRCIECGEEVLGTEKMEQRLLRNFDKDKFMEAIKT